MGNAGASTVRGGSLGLQGQGLWFRASGHIEHQLKLMLRSCELKEIQVQTPMFVRIGDPMTRSTLKDAKQKMTF